ncbi:ankyrin repeat-containing domain protein [Thelonectria olida]|uniref:Ankyrin repeat-containing domain protein n=1 Tax=Thelonectria olida TaxID=1576542 RepID=A0A9P8VRM8_9HYPO|nr:ankyrin repeat-containing domain protein [Thelonectria olida]
MLSSSSDYKETLVQTCTNLVAAVWRQLAYKSDLSNEALKLYTGNVALGTRPSFDEIFGLFEMEVKRYSKMHIVVDALDELEEQGRELLLNKLCEYPNINVFVTSRLKPEVKWSNSFQLAEIEPLLEDIRFYLSERIDREPGIQAHVKKDASLREDIVSSIEAQAQGMFLMARLQMDNLRGCASVRSLRRGLSTPLASLKSTYAELLSRILSSYMAPSATRLIGWILCATRPLTLLELTHGLSIEDGDASLDASCLVDIDRIISSCEGIVIIEKESRRVRFVHHTFQEFLERQPLGPLEQLHDEMAKSCLTYLLFPSFSSGRCNTDAEMDSRLEEHQFLLYASKSWAMHFAKSRREEIEDGDLVVRMLQETSYRESCLQAFLLPNTKYDLYSQTFPKHAPALWLACRLSIPHVVSFLLRQSHEGWLPGRDAGLLDNGASPNGAQEATNNNIPMHEASRRGPLKAVEVLHSAGADLDRRARSGRTALFEAISNGQEDIVNFLMHSGSNVRETTDDGETALRVAVEHEFPDAMEELIKLGSDVDAKDSHLNRPLHIAARRGFHRGCELLLANKCQLNPRTILQETPLHKACAAGHSETVKILLQSKADVRARNLDDSMPLHGAAQNGHLDIVRSLLDAGAEVNAADAMSRTPLHDAAENGHVDVVQLLLARAGDQSLTCRAGRNTVQKQGTGGPNIPQAPPQDRTVGVSPPTSEPTQNMTSNITTIDNIREQVLGAVVFGDKPEGAKASVYEGGVFFLNIVVPEHYPMGAPNIYFTTKIYHACVHPNGAICTETFESGPGKAWTRYDIAGRGNGTAMDWSPALTFVECLEFIFKMLDDPLLSDFAYGPATEMWHRDRAKYYETAREWTKEYAVVEEF